MGSFGHIILVSISEFHKKCSLDVSESVCLLIQSEVEITIWTVISLKPHSHSLLLLHTTTNALSCTRKLTVAFSEITFPSLTILAVELCEAELDWVKEVCLL